MYNEDSPLGVKSRLFAVRITNMVEYLQKYRNKNIKSIYNQVLRSGTSIMANIAESEFAQSRADFITKLHIALKEANETKRWLFLIYKSNAMNSVEYNSMNADCSELVAMLVTSVNTSKKHIEDKDTKEEITHYDIEDDENPSEGFASEGDFSLNF